MYNPLPLVRFITRNARRAWRWVNRLRRKLPDLLPLLLLAGLVVAPFLPARAAGPLATAAEHWVAGDLAGAYGPNSLVNGDFSAGTTGWINEDNTQWRTSDGRLVGTGSGSGSDAEFVHPDAFSPYESAWVAVTLSRVAAGSLQLMHKGANGYTLSPSLSTPGVHVMRVVASDPSDPALYLRPNGFTGSVAEVAVHPCTALGPPLIPDSGMTLSWWDSATRVSESGGVLLADNTPDLGTVLLRETSLVSAGGFYRLVVAVPQWTSGVLQWSNFNGGPTFFLSNAAGIFTGDLQATTDGLQGVGGGSDDAMTFSRISLHALSGNSLSASYPDAAGRALALGGRRDQFAIVQPAEDARPLFDPVHGALTFDGVDDHLPTGWNPGAAGTVILQLVPRGGNGTLAGRDSSGVGSLGLAVVDDALQILWGDGAVLPTGRVLAPDVTVALALAWDGAGVTAWTGGDTVYRGAAAGSPAGVSSAPLVLGAGADDGVATGFAAVDLLQAAVWDMRLADGDVRTVLTQWNGSAGDEVTAWQRPAWQRGRFR